jgi:hypothetical protein
LHAVQRVVSIKNDLPGIQITSFYILETLHIKALVSGILVFGSPVDGVSKFALSSLPLCGQRQP